MMYKVKRYCLFYVFFCIITLDNCVVEDGVFDLDGCLSASLRVG